MSFTATRNILQFSITTRMMWESIEKYRGAGVMIWTAFKKSLKCEIPFTFKNVLQEFLLSCMSIPLGEEVSSDKIMCQFTKLV